MEIGSLEKHIKRLAVLDGTKVPIVSCYLTLEKNESDWRTYVPRREAEILDSLRPTTIRSGVSGAFNSIKRWLNSKLLPESRGAAIFTRGREGDIFIPMQFGVSLPNEITVDSIPHLYHLVRAIDSHHHYIVLYSDSQSARIYEVNLGKISERMIIERPSLRFRIGQEWTKLHYKRDRREHDRQFLQQKLDILDQLYTRNANLHLILAGDSISIDRVANALPQRIAARLVDMVSISGPNSVERILVETLQAYVKAEELDSLDMVDRLFNARHRGDPALLGVAESLRAVRRGQADTLVLCHNFDLGTVYICSDCNGVASGEPRPNVCAECGVNSLLTRDARQELVRAAKSTECEVETVTESERLVSVGGAGCLLRYADALS